ncbi:MAG: phospho-sugar mutase, partial [Bacteroidales bacterium]|nr:phospho-sugar mutase [Bacteroidales bacterium]
THYLLSQWKAKQRLTGKEFIVKTVVTSELIADIARKNQVKYYDTLTGFKYIAEIIRQEEGKQTFIGGGEESYGFMIGDFVRDKDAVSSCCMIAEAAAWAADQGKTLFDVLLDIYVEYGFYLEKLHSLVRKGKEGADEIQQIMAGYRNTPPLSIAGARVVSIIDYQSGKEKDLLSGAEKPIHQPKSNVLQFLVEDGSKISVRPSGTEPKIKYYFSVKGKLPEARDYYSVKEELERKLQAMIRDLGLN